jgi:hypothetical protein
MIAFSCAGYDFYNNLERNSSINIENDTMCDLGPMLWFFKIFSPKISAKKLAFLTKSKAKLCKILIITLVFEKKKIFFAENCHKSQKIVIITSTPTHISALSRCMEGFWKKYNMVISFWIVLISSGWKKNPEKVVYGFLLAVKNVVVHLPDLFTPICIIYGVYDS